MERASIRNFWSEKKEKRKKKFFSIKRKKKREELNKKRNETPKKSEIVYGSDSRGRIDDGETEVLT